MISQNRHHFGKVRHTLKDEAGEEIPLAFLPEGEEAVIVDYHNGRAFMQRVVEMGLHRNEKVKMLKSLDGPVLVQVHDSKIALGHGVAMKIMVEKK